MLNLFLGRQTNATATAVVVDEGRGQFLTIPHSNCAPFLCANSLRTHSWQKLHSHKSELYPFQCTWIARWGQLIITPWIHERAAKKYEKWRGMRRQRCWLGRTRLLWNMKLIYGQFTSIAISRSVDVEFQGNLYLCARQEHTQDKIQKCPLGRCFKITSKEPILPFFLLFFLFSYFALNANRKFPSQRVLKPTKATNHPNHLPIWMNSQWGQSSYRRCCFHCVPTPLPSRNMKESKW